MDGVRNAGADEVGIGERSMVRRENDRRAARRNIFAAAQVPQGKRCKKRLADFFPNRIHDGAVLGISAFKRGAHDRTRSWSSKSQKLGNDVATQSTSSIVVGPSAA